ncbi:relaxase/mobilization nuclease domain-containing protein [Enterococcus hirae]|nr:relaxase/mobilization nuclease domain-containing protein [Enterococcus hirae]
MVYTKHFTIHSSKHLKQAEEYVENAAKTAIDSKRGIDSHLDNIFPYVTSDKKTINKQLVSGYGIIDVYNSAKEFLLTKQNAAFAKGKDLIFNPKTGKVVLDPQALEKNNAVLAHHIIQSFSPEDDLTPEQIHEIGRKTILEFTGGEYEFVIATHVDKAHIHNHIILNSTNTFTGNALRWQKGTKKAFEQVSDKIASKYGAKIIEKSPKNSHKKYTMWQTENLFKNKIKSRLDFLLDHSSSIDDFKIKAEALDLQVDFSGKWAKYCLLDEPQIKNTRSRSLSKKDPEKYNLDRIVERLKENSHEFSVQEVLERYEEKVDAVNNDFDYQLILESWQISHKTPKGYYVNVDFGAENHGQIFIGAYKVDQLEDGNYSLFVKKNDYFYFMNDKSSDRNRYMTGYTLAKQLSLYNGTVPLKKEPVMTTITELVDAINFLAEHGVTESKQMSRLENKLIESFELAEDSLQKLDDKILQLNQLGKLIMEEQLEDTNQEFPVLKEIGNKDELTFEDIQNELSSAKLSRKLLHEKMESTVEKINELHAIQTVAEQKSSEENLGKL